MYRCQVGNSFFGGNTDTFGKGPAGSPTGIPAVASFGFSPRSVVSKRALEAVSDPVTDNPGSFLRLPSD